MFYDLAVVVINYKTPAMTIRCAQSVLADFGDSNACLVIVDNDSGDNSHELLSTWVEENALESKVKLVFSSYNSGFSGGNNQGMKSVDANYYVLLNSDTLIRPGALQTLLKTFAQDETIGLVSPRLEDEDGTPQVSCFRNHTPISEFVHVAATGVFTKLFQDHEVAIPIIDGPSHPQWTSFACVALRGAMIKSIGYMDEGYFLYYEDCDYCRLIASHGWKIINNPEAHVVHFRGGSAELKEKVKQRKRLPQYYFESRRFYYRKHYGLLGWFAANTLWTLGRCISKLRELMQNRHPAASDMQWIDIWTTGKFFRSNP